MNLNEHNKKLLREAIEKRKRMKPPKPTDKLEALLKYLEKHPKQQLLF